METARAQEASPSKDRRTEIKQTANENSHKNANEKALESVKAITSVGHNKEVLN